MKVISNRKADDLSQLNSMKSCGNLKISYQTVISICSSRSPYAQYMTNKRNSLYIWDLSFLDPLDYLINRRILAQKYKFNNKNLSWITSIEILFSSYIYCNRATTYQSYSLVDNLIETAQVIPL